MKKKRVFTNHQGRRSLLARVEAHIRRVLWSDAPEPKHVVAARRVIAKYEEKCRRSEQARRLRLERAANAARESIHFRTELDAIEAVHKFEALGRDGN